VPTSWRIFVVFQVFVVLAGGRLNCIGFFQIQPQIESTLPVKPAN